MKSSEQTTKTAKPKSYQRQPSYYDYNNPRKAYQRRQDTQLDQFGLKLDPNQDGLITKPSRRDNRHLKVACKTCGKEFWQQNLKRHERICGKPKSYSDR